MKLRSKKAYIAVGSTLMVCLIVIVGFVIINKKQTNIFVNIDDLEPEYVEKYFDDYEKLNKKNDKSNILIVTTKKKLKDTYGATDVVNAPNNQYFLQYSSEEEKNKALEMFNKEEPDMDVSENTVSEISEDTVLVSNYNSWGVEAMGIDTLLDEFQGKELNDVTVAIVDTGLDVDVFNASFAGRLAGTYNVLENNDNMYDNNGHGTHIAGTIAESTPSSVKILPVKVSDTREMYETDIITAINYVTYNKNADVMNMSFGGYAYSQGEYIAIEAARQNNIISVAGAGNNNLSDLFYPASFDNTISITAVDSNKTKASFSNYGEAIMFSTPGVNIKSIASKEENSVMSGTSMATPHAVSAIANLKSLNKNLAYDNIVTILRRYSDDLGDIGWDQYYGYGFINFADAKVCDGADCDEFNVFKKSSRDNLDEEVDGYEIEPVLTTYNYGSVNNILNSKVVLKFTNGKTKEYKLYDINNLEISDYDPYSLEKQTINIKFTTSLGIKVDGSFEVTNPTDYESVWEYQNVGDNNIELTGFKDTSFTNTLLYFPSVIDGYSVTGIADRDTSMFLEAKDSFIKVRKIFLPSSIVKVGNKAFYMGGSALGINVVKSYADNLSVGNLAFSDASSLYDLEANISYVGDFAFGGARSLPNFPFSDSITHIGYGAFDSAFNNGVITIPESVTEIGEQAFRASGLKEIKFLNDNKIELIPSKMMSYSDSLEKVTLPEGIKEIGEMAFSNTKKLNTINLPESLTTLGDSVFSEAFNGGKLVIPKNVTTIGTNALYKTGLKEIEFLNKMETIPTNMMYYSSNLEKVVLPEGLKEIGDSAFRLCNKLITINLPESLTTIGSSAFEEAFDSSKAPTIVIPKNVTSIRGSVFKKSGLKEVTILSNTLRAAMFNESENLEKVTLPETITEIPSYIFNGCKSLKEINLPEGLITIGDEAFQGCEKLSIIDLPKELRQIGDNAFNGAFKANDNIKITIPANVTTIGTKAFANSGIKEVKFLNSISKISDRLFLGANKLEKVILPSNLTELNGYDFTDCTSLKSIYFDKNISSIVDDRNVFEGLKDTLTFYVYSNTVPKTYAKSKNINYVQIDPDTIDVKNIKSKYSAFEKVNIDDVSLELTYDEKTTRKETISNNIEIVYPDSREDFRYGDTSIKVIAYNERGYKVEKDVNVEVVKATPKYTVPKNLTAEIGQKLYDISLPENFAWTSDNVIFDKNGRYKFTATYTPTDLTNYEVVNDIEITVNVGDVSSLHTITYNSNDENGLTSTQEVEENVKTKLNKNTFTRDGYEFIGWNTKADGKGTAYTDEQKVSIKDDLVLYAQWEKVITNITFDANGGTVSIDSMKIPDDGYYGELPIPYKENAGFVNWSCKSDGTRVTYNSKVSCTELVATWVDNAYTFILDANGGTLGAPFDENNSNLRINSRTNLSTFFLNDGRYPLNDNMFVKNDKVFKEWNTKADGSGKIYLEGQYVGKDDVVLENNTFKLYAIWEDKPNYKINDYYVDKTNHYISKIMAGTNVEVFKSKIDLNAGYRVEVDTKNIDDKEVMYTGGKTRIYNGDVLEVTYTNIVIGDVNGDGAINSADLLRIRQHLLGNKSLSGENFLASDINYDSDINSADILRVRQHLLGTKTIS